MTTAASLWVGAATMVSATSLPPGGDSSNTGKRAGAWIETWYALDGNYIWENSLIPGTTSAAPSASAAALVDVNGDGLDDAVVWGSSGAGGSAVVDEQNGFSGLVVSLSTGKTFSSPVHAGGIGCDDNSTVNFGDGNGDGRADLLCVVASKGYYIAQGSSAAAPWFEPLAAWSSTSPPAPGTVKHRWLVDVNNDSKADVVEWVLKAAAARTITEPRPTLAVEQQGALLQVHLSTGSGFEGPVVWKNTVSSDRCSSNAAFGFVADVNKDGCSDFVCVQGLQDGACWMVGLSDCRSRFGDMTAWKCGPLPQQQQGQQQPLPLYLQRHSRRQHSASRQHSSTPRSGRLLMADVNLDGVADALYFDPDANAGTWYVSLSDGKASFATSWSLWMSQHGRNFVHSKPIGAKVATNLFVGMPFSRNFSESPAPVAVWPDGQWKVAPTCGVYGCYGSPCEYNTWEAWDMRYVPRINGQYRWFDTADVEAIDDTIDSLQGASVDYIIVDLTNTIQTPFILKRTRAFLKRLADRRASKTAVLQFAFGLGWYWSNDPATFEQQAQLAWSWFYNNETYGAPSASAKGDQSKPLLIQYGTIKGKVAWLNYTGNKTFSDKFDIKWSYGSTPTRDPEGMCPGMEPTPYAPPGVVWMPPKQDWG